MSDIHLPIFKSALDLSVYIEEIVKGWERYVKYTFGVELREQSRKILFLINRANIASKAEKKEKIKELIGVCEDMKVLIILAKELKAFKSFKQFEYSSKLSVEICKQAQGWYNNNAVIRM